MSMISFKLMGLLGAVFCLLYIYDRLRIDDRLRHRLNNWTLIAASLVFVAYANLLSALVLTAVTVVTWYFAKNRKYWYIGVILSVLTLGVFKYTNFVVSSAMEVFGKTGTTLNILLPVGISFFTFSAVSYLVDVHRGELEARNLEDVAAYITFFPKLTSGPIQRSGDFFGQSDRRRQVGMQTFLPGVQIFVFGLFKKLVMADRLSVFVDQVYETPMIFSGFSIFLGVIAYSFQIYFDFSGYSDMAIGAAKMLGYDLPVNFNLPYLAHNVTELWKRWHITLSTWLMKYVYISLGGNRKGKARTYLNLVLTMVIGGIWHGANWTYIIWGFLHGIALAVHKAWMTLTGSNEKKHGIPANIISIAATFLFTTFCWIFFRAPSLHSAVTIIKRMFTFQTGVNQPYFWLFVTVAMYFAAMLPAVLRSRGRELKARKLNTSFVRAEYPVLDLSKFWNLVAFFVFCGLLIALAYTGGSPFIYGNY